MSQGRIPSDEFIAFVTEPTSLSICVACPTCGEFTNLPSETWETRTGTLQLRETASNSTYSAKGDTLIENQVIFILILQFDLFYESKTTSHSIQEGHSCGHHISGGYQLR